MSKTDFAERAHCAVYPEPRTPNPERTGERGVVLGVVIITSVIFGIAAFGLLSFAMNQAAQTSFVSEKRTRARYAAESGLVYAMEQLWVNPNDCTLGPPGPLDTDNDGTPDATVTVTRPGPCPAPSGAVFTLQAQVTF